MLEKSKVDSSLVKYEGRNRKGFPDFEKFCNSLPLFLVRFSIFVGIQRYEYFWSELIRNPSSFYLLDVQLGKELVASNSMHFDECKTEAIFTLQYHPVQ